MSHGSAEDSALALFNEVVRPPADAPDAQAPAAPSPILSEWEAASKIKSWIEADMDSEQALQHMLHDVRPLLQSYRPGNLPRHLYTVSLRLLNKTLEFVVRHSITGRSVQISEMYCRLGRWDLDVRNDLVLSLCQVLIAGDVVAAERDAVVQELLDMWKHICQLKRKSSHPHSSYFALPSVADVRADINKSRSRTLSSSRSMDPAIRAMTAILLQYPPPRAVPIVPGLLATLSVLSDPRFQTPETQAEAAPFLQLAAESLSKGEWSESLLLETFSHHGAVSEHVQSQLREFVVTQWPNLLEYLESENTHWRSTLARTATGAKGSHKNVTLSQFHKNLRGAYRARNVGAIASVWQDLKGSLAQNPGFREQLAHEATFLDFWVFVSCAVRRPALTQEILALMKELGVQSTVKTYTAMMHGWRMCKDIDRIEALWTTLVESRMKLDYAIWTERISALIELGKPEAGLKALTEMHASWKKSSHAQGYSDDAAPTVMAVNAVFKGLIGQDPKAAHEVLAWAAREGVDPDVRTYNILLREKFRTGEPKGVTKVLHAMKASGVEPDGATFTIILEEVLGAMHQAPASEQALAVRQILSDIESAGLKANLETYGKMLYAVASLPNGGADDAIQAIREHMRTRGFTSFSPHMITILVERAARRNPPDLAAVRAVLQEFGLDSVERGDQTLWERVMSVYAIGGDVDGALRIFDDLACCGRPVTSLPCLRDLLQALLGQDRRDDAAKVVGVVVRSKMRSEQRAEDRYWKHHFWFLAARNGLLHDLEVPEELRRVMQLA